MRPMRLHFPIHYQCAPWGDRLAIAMLTAHLWWVAAIAHAAVATTGNVTPSYPGTNPDPWNVGTELAVAKTTNATLIVNSGSGVTSLDGIIASDPGTIGAVTVSGSGSSL